MQTMSTSVDVHDEAERAPADAQGGGRPRARALASAAFSGRFSALWALVACVVGFGLATPSTFLTTITLKTVLADEAITGMLALAVLVPLVVGVFDLSVAAVAGFAMLLVSWLSVHTSLPTALLCLIVVVGSTGFGLLSGALVAKLGTNSLVTTLGMATFVTGITQLVAAQNQVIPRFGNGFLNLGQGYVWIFPAPFVYFAALSVIAYVVLEHTPAGRRARAVGGNPIAARLAGIRVDRTYLLVLVLAALISGITGIVLAAQVGVATDSSALSYLLPAIAALFLGATQVVNRPNVLGTIVAVLLLGTGTKGLQLLGADIWVVQVFNGAVLLVAVAIAAGGVNRIK